MLGRTYLVFVKLLCVVGTSTSTLRTFNSMNTLKCRLTPVYIPLLLPTSGPVFSYKLRYNVHLGLVEMAISTNPKCTSYRNLYENTGPVTIIFVYYSAVFISAFYPILSSYGLARSTLPHIIYKMTPPVFSGWCLSFGISQLCQHIYNKYYFVQF